MKKFFAQPVVIVVIIGLVSLIVVGIIGSQYS
jgi:hypothetical protein